MKRDSRSGSYVDLCTLWCVFLARFVSSVPALPSARFCLLWPLIRRARFTVACVPLTQIISSSRVSTLNFPLPIYSSLLLSRVHIFFILVKRVASAIHWLKKNLLVFHAGLSLNMLKNIFKRQINELYKCYYNY